MQRKLTPRGKERRQQLVDHAARLFAERGYHPTSVSDVVESLGVGKGVFYWYFTSKEDLFLDILASAHHDLRKAQQAALEDEPDPLRRIELGIRASFRWSCENRHLVTLFQFAASEERFAGALRQNDEIAVDDVSRHIKEAMVEGRIADQDPALLAHCLIGVVRHLSRRYVLPGEAPIDEITAVGVAFSLHGLTGVAAAPAPPLSKS